MEDSGTLQSLTFLAKAGRVDLQRVLVLRTASDFDSPPPGMTAAEGLARNKIGQYAGYLPALEAAWRVGHLVVRNLTENWGRYRDQLPESASRQTETPANFRAGVRALSMILRRGIRRLSTN